MSATEVHAASRDGAVGKVDLRLEVQIIPVSDVDRAKQFYERLGFRLDADDAPMDGLRIVQFTPPGSGTSVTFGLGITTAAPGSAEGGLIVSDIEAAHHQLAGRGIEVSDIWHGPPFPVEARQPGPDPERTSYGSFFYFTDPDANTWLVQEVTTRRPGVMDAGETGYVSAADLEAALRRAEAAHGEHERRTGHRLKAELAERVQAEDWPAWYAAYMVSEQAGTELPT
jgi:catechol 2,3-dioxygenase-like lactoylglutathione lyase family enzyme